MDYIYGKLCQRVKNNDYSGSITETSETVVDNSTNKISVNVNTDIIATKEYVEEEIGKVDIGVSSIDGVNGEILLDNNTLEIDDNTKILSVKNLPYLPLSGGTMEGDIVLGNNTHIKSVNGFSSLDVDNSGFSLTSGGTADFGIVFRDFGSNHRRAVIGADKLQLKGVINPTNDTDGANKIYVDNKVDNLVIELQSIDGGNV